MEFHRQCNDKCQSIDELIAIGIYYIWGNEVLNFFLVIRYGILLPI